MRIRYSILMFITALLALPTGYSSANPKACSQLALEALPRKKEKKDLRKQRDKMRKGLCQEKELQAKEKQAFKSVEELKKIRFENDVRTWIRDMSTDVAHQRDVIRQWNKIRSSCSANQQALLACIDLEEKLGSQLSSMLESCNTLKARLDGLRAAGKSNQLEQLYQPFIQHIETVSRIQKKFN